MEVLEPSWQSNLRGCRRQERVQRQEHPRQNKEQAQKPWGKKVSTQETIPCSSIVWPVCMCYLEPFSARWVVVSLHMDGDVRACLFTRRTAVFSQRHCACTVGGCPLCRLQWNGPSWRCGMQWPCADFMRTYVKTCLWKCPYVHVSGYLHRSDM